MYVPTRLSLDQLYFIVHSVFELNFRWHLRRPKIIMKPNTVMQAMNPKWIRIDPVCGVLERETDTQFTLNVTGDTQIPGSYRYILE